MPNTVDGNRIIKCQRYGGAGRSLPFAVRCFCGAEIRDGKNAVNKSQCNNEYPVFFCIVKLCIRFLGDNRLRVENARSKLRRGFDGIAFARLVH